MAASTVWKGAWTRVSAPRPACPSYLSYLYARGQAVGAETVGRAAVVAADHVLRGLMIFAAFAAFADRVQQALVGELREHLA